MRHLARLSLAVGGLSLALPTLVQAQAPAQAPIPIEAAPLPIPAELPAPAPTPVVTTAPVSMPVPTANRNANGEYVIPTGISVSAKDAPAMEAQLRRMGPPTAVSESYTVQGQPVVITSSGSAPGRAVATDAPTGYGSAVPGEPMPIGVMRTNYSNVPPAAMGPAGYGRPGAPAPGMGAPGMGAPGSSPLNPMMGRHGVPMDPSAGATPYLPSSSANPRPRVFAHLFGLEGIGNAMRDAREARLEARKRNEILKGYARGSMPTEIPAEAVYGGKRR